MKKIKDYYNSLTPRGKQVFMLVSLVLLVSILLMAISMAFQTQEKKKEKKLAQQTSKKMSLLTDKVEKDLWVAAEGQNIKALEKSNEELRIQIERLQKELAETKEIAKKKPVTPSPAMPTKGLPLPPSLVKKEGGGVVTVPPPPPPDAGAARVQPQSGATTTCQGNTCTSTSHPPGAPAYPNLSDLKSPPSPSPGAGMQVSTPPPAKGGIRVFREESSLDKKVTEKKQAVLASAKKKQDTETYLPAGSFFRATLLSGLDAPTSGGLKSDPYPVLMMVTDLSILPNRYRMNIKECHLIGAGFGNVSDERAYIRTETLSCIRTDGKVIEVGMKGQAVGEDGKLGIRGRLVSKQGQQLAMAIFAGTLSGIGTALKPSQIPSLQVTGTSDSVTAGIVRPELGSVAEAGAYSGASRALEMIAQYYLKMAEKMFPIIEIDAGREIEIVILKGQKLKITESSKRPA
ncbi:MAG TPA: TrbI/VirB10 family protein [Methanoregulaceae archaeon]|nr:TrbI/VirB10 family protein [Sedimentisphaerales bacterium]HPD11327.1 TrbI/VirB10 family protein [Methanoregulaceae archaeon]